MELINALFMQLEQKGSVAPKYNPHKLTGNYRGFWECHIQPDWLLIWLHNNETKSIQLTRTGTNSDLF